MRMHRILIIFLIGSAAAADPLPRDVISELPRISYTEQCRKDDLGHTVCDHSIENRVFTTLSSLGEKFLHRGMSKPQVREIFGPPPSYISHGQRQWRDQRYARRIDLWPYATGLSGTRGYFLVFVDGCLDFFGTGMWGRLPAYYGRPDTRPELLPPDEPYRVDEDASSCMSQ